MIRIDVLPDDVLLEIFDFYVDFDASNRYENRTEVEGWQLLVHVCQRWRSLVLESPRRLNLRLYCTPETPVKYTLDVWPALPLIIYGGMESSSSTDNVIAALGQSSRVCQLELEGLVDRQLEEVLAAMQVPFPELTELWLGSEGGTQLVIPDSFLGGSVPRLRYFTLDGIPFPGLPKLLLSATHLVRLWLTNIPHSGYISPEATVALISVLPSLRSLFLEFQSPQSRPDQEIRRPHPSKRSVIPALIALHFKGVIEYLEDLVTRIDAPQLKRMRITLFNQIDFDIPRLTQFINCTPKLRAPDAHVQFDDYHARVVLRPEFRTLEIAISCREPDWQLSSIEQVCNSSLNSLPSVEDLYIEHRYLQPLWKNDAIENTRWLQLLLPFTAVKNLYLSKVFAPGIAATLQELAGGRITEVLPSLQNIFVEGLEPWGRFQENTRQFVVARELSNHTIIAISVWDKYSNTKPM